MANIYKTPHINSYQNQSSIVEAMIKNVGVFFMPNGVKCSSAECSVECVPTHLEAELVVILVEGDVHQTATEAVVGKHKEHVLENLVNLSQVLSHSTHHVPVVGGARVTWNCEIKSYVTAP